MRSLAPVLLAGLLGGLAALAFRAPERDFLLGGVQVNEPDHAVWVEALERSGMNAVAVTVYAHQGDWDSANLWFDDEDPWVVAEARAARARGLEVVLVLRVALDHAFPRNKFLWHGMIQPRTEADLDEWFRRYGAFVERWASIAEREGIGVVAIASELNSLTNTVPVAELPVLEEYWTNAEKVERERRRVLAHREAIERRDVEVRGFPGYESLAAYLVDRDRAHAEWAKQVAWAGEPDALERVNARRRLLAGHWSGIVERARAAFPGTLTYAANFDQYEFVSFWDRLDAIGINAYFPLRRHSLEGLGEEDLRAHLTAGWSRVLSGLDAFRARRGLGDRPVLFTELGYVRRANSTIQPWAASGFSVLPSRGGERLMIWEEQPPSRRERALALAALYDAHLARGGEPLAGILYWKLTTDPGHEAIEPFALVLGDGARPDGASEPDPLLAEMTRFTRRLPFDLWKRGVAERWREWTRRSDAADGTESG